MPIVRRGFTVVELMIVIVIIGTLALLVLPRFSGLQERNRLVAARQDIAAAIATARAVAIQKGRPAQVVLSGNNLLVTATTAAGGQQTIVPLKPLDSLYQVTVQATDTMITFDSRGFAQPRLGSSGIFRLLGTSRRDSVCVTSAGQIMPRECTL